MKFTDSQGVTLKYSIAQGYEVTIIEFRDILALIYVTYWLMCQNSLFL